ncbi:chymotrypsin family serine protease [[Mycobacterium] nativiensis]|uniref:Peptidase S1 domain-containing protein n=1 Tax=[Mycobacterium] nativiensis TaxID=2855503 RepID=A0ABU5XYK4_9MYCO|nr:hypothetical protein [Mycolicibacter sp. MYC340]MEB3031775.1 hypothetical protein [Mycolicibacter sp. MYC340]
MARKTLAAVLSGVAIAAAMLSAPPALASVNLVVGMPISFKHSTCSLGFFAFDKRKDRLAVTAGHCGEAIHEPVYNKWGQQFGEIVARMPDRRDDDGRLIGARGYTIIYLYPNFSLEPFFTRTGSIGEGDRVTKVAGRSGKTSGQITKVVTNDRPDLSLLYSDMVQLRGDSGGPWLTGKRPVLVGIGSSGNQEREGRDATCQGQPISSLVELIGNTAGRYADGFTVWTE